MTLEIRIDTDPTTQEMLAAVLSDIGFEGFVHENEHVRAFISSDAFTPDVRDQTNEHLLRHGLPPATTREWADQNWNQTWESGIEPIAVGGFLIRPAWAEPTEEQANLEQLIITPKMSFGTGHHETTRLMVQGMKPVIKSGDRVLDAGTGTGILAIASIKLGAASAIGFDTDEWCRDNAPENFAVNGTAETCEVRHGSLETVAENDFDVVLANINRNALLSLLSGFHEKTRPGGSIILSGLLATDRDTMMEQAAELGWMLVLEGAENEWISLTFRTPDA